MPSKMYLNYVASCSTMLNLLSIRTFLLYNLFRCLQCCIYTYVQLFLTVILQFLLSNIWCFIKNYV
jgi:hypothetical protein